MPEIEFAKTYDLESYFLSWEMNPVRVLTNTPMIQLARSAARNAPFGTTALGTYVESARVAMAVLRETKTFCSPGVMHELHEYARKMSADPSAPRYTEPPWVAHQKHIDSGNTGICPCRRCQVTEEQLQRAKILQMPTPELKM
jgi:hypothetical protein